MRIPVKSANPTCMLRTMRASATESELRIRTGQQDTFRAHRTQLP